MGYMVVILVDYNFLDGSKTYDNGVRRFWHFLKFIHGELHVEVNSS